MFELLTDKLSKIFKGLGSKGRLSEKDIDAALKEVRLALLEADVNFKVVKSLVAQVRERAIASSVLESLTPAQQIIKIVNEELTAVIGGGGGQSRLLPAPHPPTVVMLIGLQGSGKTTTAAKLALNLRHSGQRSLLVAADTRRPAAIEQLIALGKQLDVPVYSEDPKSKPISICKNGVKRAKELAVSWVLLDTGGRLHIDDELMKELTDIKKDINPTEVLLVVDAMTGQDAVRAAEEFQAKVGLTGLIMTKMDGDARGGAALSIRSVTGVPIKFMGIGEKADALEVFYPDRLASRILGMGDMLTLIEKTQQNFDQTKAEALQKKMQSATLTLEDFLEQLQQVKKMGPLNQIVDMIPGLSKLTKQMPQGLEDSQLKRVEAIVLSMTPEERRNPSIIDGRRRRRIARGSGTTPQDVNQLMNQFNQMQKMMKQFGSGKGRNLLSMLGKGGGF